MGKAFIFLVLGTITILSIIVLNMNNNLNDSVERSVDIHAETQARYIANSIANIAITKLSKDNSLRYNNKQSVSLFDGSGYYTMKDTVLGIDSLVQIRAQGNFMDRKKEVLVYVKIPTGESASLPPFLNYAIFGHEEVKLNGNTIKIRHAQTPTFNTDIHSNDMVNFNGADIGVEGFVTYKNSHKLDGSNITINPINNPDSSDAAYKSGTIDLPAFKASDYLADADVVYNGDKSLSGDIYLGTKTNPKIIYVKGKLDLQGNTFGYGVFIAEDEVSIKGDLKSNTPDPNYSKVGIFTDKKAKIDDNNITVHSTFFANEEVVVNCNGTNIWGGIVSKSKASLNGDNLTLYYKPLDADVASGFWDVKVTGSFTGRLEALHYYE